MTGTTSSAWARRAVDMDGDGQTEALWAAIADGTIDVIGTDHAPHTRAEKEIGWTDMWKAAGGLPHLQETLPLFLDQVAAGRLSLERLVDIGSANPARLFGLWPTKGAIQPGSDADLAIVDVDATWTIRHDDVLSKCGWTARDGIVVGEPGWGRLVGPIRDSTRCSA